MPTKTKTATKKTPRRRSAPTPKPTSKKPTPRAASRRASSAVSTAGIRIRMYRVGFGDFFLVTLTTSDGDKHILIDCGVHAGDVGSIAAAVADMATLTQSTLSLVIMTHRHADHISGFARCKTLFAQFSVGRVWMPWFENPANPKASAFQANLVAVAAKLRVALAARNDPASLQYQAMAKNITGEPMGVLGVSSNDVALDVLHGGFKYKAPVDYYKAGDIPTLPPDLGAAGLVAQILGPPIDPSLIAQMDAKNHQYLTIDDDNTVGPISRVFDRPFVCSASAYPNDAFSSLKASGLETLIADAQPDLTAAKAQQADNTLNNQSLVVLFTFNGKKLFFVGDAQWGNWQNFLYDGPIGKSATLSQRSTEILGAIDFYKVGHHGSTNATPIDALDAMHAGVTAMCSTQPGCYGTAAKGTEVPRLPLLDALDKKTGGRVARSDQVAVPGYAVDKALQPLDTAFSSPDDKMYVDLLL